METAFEILEEGCIGNKGFSKTLFKKLVNASTNGRYIFEAGFRWLNFQFEYGQPALEKLDKYGNFILLSGMRWKTFDYDSGLAKLEELQPNGYWLYKAKHVWPLNKTQINNILFKDTGIWTFEEYKLNYITKEEAIIRKSNIKWQRKIEKFSDERKNN